MTFFGLNIKETINFFYTILDPSSLPNYLIFLIFVLLAIFIGQIFPNLLKLIFYLSDRKQENNFYNLIFKPIQSSIKICSTLIVIYLAFFLWLREDQELYQLLEPLIGFVALIAIAWIISRILTQLIRVYGIKLLRQSGLVVDEMVLVFETLANIAIGFITFIIYAEARNFSWLGLFAGISLGGAVFGFAASKTADDFFGTILLYLDRRFFPGEYIRLPIMNTGRAEEVFGRIESIGWRSTTIRVAGKNTLYIVSNAILARDEVENVSRGKKVMVLIYLDFMRKLEDREQRLIEQVIIDSTEKLFGIAPNSTNVNFTQQLDLDLTRAMVNFSILGSTETSIELRKNILESTYEEISEKLRGFGIEFVAQEPNIYVEAPITI